ncbi:MAG: TerB family tellurite resistance protein [Sandaracinaceae bacterium]
MFFRRRPDRPPPPSVSDTLLALVRDHMPDADAGSHAVIAAVAGLVACVAYADGEYHPNEKREVERLLGRVHDLPRNGVRAISSLLETRIAELARAEMHAHARAMKEGAEPEARLEVLDVLMDLAASDGVLSVQETELLRRIAGSLGLSPDEYNAAQARHRDKLSVLR